MDRTDTSGRRGGGIIIYAKKEMQVWKEAFEINFMHCTSGSKKEKIIGDFNFPGIEWENGRADAKGREFLNVAMDVFLDQYVKTETQTSGNILDLVLSRDENAIRNISMEGRLGKSDHEMMVIEVNMAMKNVEKGGKYCDLRAGNYDEVRKHLARD